MPGGVRTQLGSIDSAGPTWQRRSGTCGPWATQGAYHYESFPLLNATGDVQTVRVDYMFPVATRRGHGAGESLPPGLVFVYDHPFDPTNPSVGCRFAQEGAGLHSEFAITLQPGEWIEVVASLSLPTIVDHFGPAYLRVETLDRCGDGVLGETEACDDGNTVGGDGCSSDCRTVEFGYTCMLPGDDCVSSVCGDGFVGGDEECDPALHGATGCSPTCTVMPGWSCPPDQSCHPVVCGDGFIDSPETCDDFGASIGSGCDANCQIEFINSAGLDGGGANFPVPVGRWIATTSSGFFNDYKFMAEPDKTYVIEAFVGAPYECQATSPDIRLSLRGNPINEGYFVWTIDTDRGHGVGGCPRLVWTAPSMADGFFGEELIVSIMAILQNYDPFYVWIHEAP